MWRIAALLYFIAPGIIATIVFLAFMALERFPDLDDAWERLGDEQHEALAPDETPDVTSRAQT
jgi:hypothetical protein